MEERLASHPEPPDADMCVQVARQQSRLEKHQGRIPHLSSPPGAREDHLAHHRLHHKKQRRRHEDGRREKHPDLTTTVGYCASIGDLSLPFVRRPIAQSWEL